MKEYRLKTKDESCFWTEIVSGDLVLREHAAAKWLTKEELNSVDWLPADITLIEKIKNYDNQRKVRKDNTGRAYKIRRGI